jgi:nucleotide-binding universal stress UspA family protein
MYTIRTILHPTDFSQQAAVAFRLACSMAKEHNAQLIVLHVIPHPVAWADMTLPPCSAEYQEHIREDYLLPIQPFDPSIQIEHHLEEGTPDEMIVSIAEELKCDLIVMGTHGRTGFNRLFMGSVAEHVLRAAPCPVLTVREPFPGDAQAAPQECAKAKTSL